MGTRDAIERFLAGDVYAVVGASADRAKYGNRVLRCYLQNGREAHPVNPRGGTIEGRTVHPDVGSVPKPVHGASFVTPPEVTLALLDECAEAGIHHVWMQPGAESPAVVERAAELGLDAVADGSCLLVVLGFRE